MLLAQSISESIVQSGLLQRDSCIFDITVEQIHLNILSIWLSLIFFWYWVRIKSGIFFSSSIYKTNVVKSFNPLNSDNKSISFFLIANSLSLSCSSEFKEFKVSELQVFA